MAQSLNYVYLIYSAENGGKADGGRCHRATFNVNMRFSIVPFAQILAALH